MLKKILSIILLTLLFINYSFAYNPTYKDKQIVNKINYKIGKIHKINFEKINILESNIKKLVVKYSYNTRIKYVLNKVLEYIDSLKNPNDFTLIEEIFNTDNSENDSDENNSNINDSQSSENTCVNDTNRFDKTATFLRDVYVTPNTLKDAIRNVKPGDIIHLSAGIYPGGNYITNFQATKQNPIKIQGPSNGEAIISGGTTGMQIVNGQYVILKNFTVSGASANGINLDDGGDYSTPAHHIIVDNLTIKNIGTGGNNDSLKMSGVDDFHVFNSNFRDGSTGGSGIDMVGCHNGYIYDNSFYNLGSNFIQMKGGTSEILVTNNFFKKVNHRGINMGGSTGFAYFRPSISDGTNYEAKNLKVIKNTFVDTNSAIAFVGCYNCEASYNIIYQPRTWAFRILQETVSLSGTDFIKSSHNTFSNNIIAFNNSIRKLVNVGGNTLPSTFTMDNNLWYAIDNQAFDYNAYKSELPVVDSNIKKQINPMFVDELNENFKLKSSSSMHDVFSESCVLK